MLIPTTSVYSSSLKGVEHTIRDHKVPVQEGHWLHLSKQYRGYPKGARLTLIAGSIVPDTAYKPLGNLLTGG